jgi:putative heme iron utilization protein
MQVTDYAALRTLLFEQRQAALGTLAEGAPFVSMVLYAIDRRTAPAAALIHVSRLAAHTRQLLADPRASLLIMQPDDGLSDPQALPRVTLQCRATMLSPATDAYAAARAIYLACIPSQEYLFAFPDFVLFRLELLEARYIGGFAQAFSLDAATLAQVLGVG